MGSCGDGVVTCWDANDYTARIRCWQRGCESALCATATPDILVTGYADGKLRSFDMYQGSLLWEIDDAHRGGTNCVQIARNARFICSGGKEGELRVWELRTREMVWDLQAEKRLTTHREKHGGVNSLVLLEDQTTVISSGQERFLTMWDLRTRDHVHRVGTESEIMSLSYFRGNGGLIAAGGTDRKVSLWDPRNLTCGQAEAGHSQPIETVAFSADGKQVVSGGYDQCLFVWNVFPLN